jgi:hypothetical protein
MTAKALAQSAADEISDALLEALEQSSPVRLSPSWSVWMRRALGGPHAFIVVDALDELLESEHVGFQTQAKCLEDLQLKIGKKIVSIISINTLLYFL